MAYSAVEVALIFSAQNRMGSTLGGITNALSDMERLGGRANLGMIGLVGTATAIAGVFLEAANQANKFQSALASIQSQTGTTASGMRQIADAALKLGGSGNSQFDATTLAQGSYKLLSSGFDPGKSAKALDVLSKTAAIAGQGNLSIVSDAITGLADTFGSGQNTSLDTIKLFADELTMAEQRGKVAAGQIAQVIPTFGGASNAAGLSISEALSFVSKETLAGETATQSGANLRGLLTQLVLNPNRKTMHLAGLLGIETGQNAVTDAGGIYNYLQEIQGRTGGDTNLQSALLGKFGSRGYREIFQGGGISQAQDLQSNIAGSKGTVDQQYQVTQQGIAAQWKTLTAEFSTDMTKLGLALIPFEKALVSGAKDILKAAEWFAKEVPNVVDKAQKGGNWLDQHLPFGLKAQDIAAAGVVPGIGPLVSILYRHFEGGGTSNTEPAGTAAHMAADNSLLTSIMGVVLGNSAVRGAINDAAAFVNDAGGGLSGAGGRRRGSSNFTGSVDFGSASDASIAAAHAYLTGGATKPLSPRAHAMDALDTMRYEQQIALMKGETLAQQEAFLQKEKDFELFHKGDLGMTTGQINFDFAQKEAALRKQMAADALAAAQRQHEQLLADANTQMHALQDKVTLAQLGRGSLSAAQGNLTAYERSHMGLLGMTADDILIQQLQNAGAKTANVANVLGMTGQGQTGAIRAGSLADQFGTTQAMNDVRRTPAHKLAENSDKQLAAEEKQLAAVERQLAMKTQELEQAKQQIALLSSISRGIGMLVAGHHAAPSPDPLRMAGVRRG